MIQAYDVSNKYWLSFATATLYMIKSNKKYDSIGNIVQCLELRAIF